jgi:hypothetical protein
MDVKQTLSKKELIDASKKTYEVAKNYNANFLLKEGVNWILVYSNVERT